MMRSPRMYRAASRVVSGKEAFSFGAAGGSTARDGSGDGRVVSVPSPPPSASASSTTFADVAAVWSDWESVDPEEVEREEGEMERELGLDRAPSPDELRAAMWSLQQISILPQERDDDENSDSGTAEMDVSVPRMLSSAESESDWIEPAIHACSEISSSSNNRQKALEAFHQLKVNPSIQRMVASLSSDQAVWDVVMKNEAVQEIKKSFCEGISDAKIPDSTGPVESIFSALGSVFNNTKTTVMELVEKVTTFVNNLVHSSENKGDEKSEFFADAVKSSLMLSIFVFLIVIVGRLQK
ncbi:UvrABC system protein C [Rhynchospora pubera]|uniref:UvrABC system protein C n=1 Tax=Rhynchospora pubera TaxID=906938 RepID=A0AAV8H5F3_9POAL|nr:UvrABC system protein C [Rhynchospora pubera]